MSPPTPDSTASDAALRPYWEDDHVQLYLGDMREVLPALGVTADLIVADPPYEETELNWDRWPDGWVNVAATVSSNMWCFGSMRMFLERRDDFAAWKLSQDAVWEKHAGSGPAVHGRLQRIHEHILHWYRGPWSGIYHAPQRVPHDGPSKGAVRTGLSYAHRGDYRPRSWTDDGTRALQSVLHVRSMHQMNPIQPTQKPLGILAPLIACSSPPDGLVVDPFAGSGATLEAVRLSGRRAIGVEVAEPRAEAAARRLAQAPLEIA